MTTESKPWVSSTGLPTAHAVLAAAHVAAVIGTLRARVVDTRESYWHKAVGGQFSSSDLQIGEELLIDCGFIELIGDELVVQRDLSSLIKSGDTEFATVVCAEIIDSTPEIMSESKTFLDELAVLVPDTHRREAISRRAKGLFDDSLRKLVGQIGEEIVLARAQTQLMELGHPELVATVRHVSLYDDTAGYDIVAPCVDKSERLLEVKSTTHKGESIDIFLSRNEAMTGARLDNWWLVICHVNDIEGRNGEVIGWVQGSTISERLPMDATGGVWQTAKLEIPLDRIVGGLPSAVA